MFSWLDTKDANAFAKTLVEDLAGRIPPPLGRVSKKITPERVQNAHDAIVARVAAFARSHSMNWYKKAHFGNTFRWALQERGYDKDFIDTWTHSVLVASARKQHSPE